MKSFGVELRQVERLVDAELLLRAEDAVLARLGEVEAGALRRAELGDHLLVVRERDLDGDAGLLGELLHDLGRGVVGPGQEPQRLG